MNNPFAQQRNHTGFWIAGITFGALAAGTAAWLYIKNKMEAAAAAARHLDAPYHKQPDHQKKPKSAVGELHAIVPGTHVEQGSDE